MTSIYYLAALGAAFCWASASMLARHPVKEIGEFAFIRIRMVVSFLLLALICFFSGKFSNINFQQIDLIVLSGLIGIFFGDSFLFLFAENWSSQNAATLLLWELLFVGLLLSVFVWLSALKRAFTLIDIKAKLIQATQVFSK